MSAVAAAEVVTSMRYKFTMRVSSPFMYALTAVHWPTTGCENGTVSTELSTV